MNSNTTEQELWVNIIGYEELYAISNYGNIVSLNYRRRKDYRKTLVLMEDKDGYLTITLCKNGIKSLKKVHRLVGEHFIPNPFNLPEINHKYGDKKNNYYKDLEWTTRSNNILHSYEIGLKPRTTEKQQAAIRCTNELKKKSVYQYSIQGYYITKYDSLKDAANIIKGDIGNISACCLGKIKTSSGFIWSYKKL